MYGCLKTAQVRRWIRWWHDISSDLGIHICTEQLFQCGKKCFCVEKYEGFSSEQSSNIPNSDLSCGCRFHWTITSQVCAETVSGTCSTTFDHVWPQEGPGDEVILAISDTDMRLCHKARALLLEWFLVALSHGKVLFSDERAIYCCSLKCFLGQNVILITCLRCKTTHHTWW